MASESSLESKVHSGRYYMNKLFGRTVEQARSLERNGKSGHALGTVRRVTIEPQSGGRHRVVIEHSSVIDERGNAPASVDRIGGLLSSEHSFGSAGDALRFLSDILSDRPPTASGGGDADRFLDQVLDEHGGN